MKKMVCAIFVALTLSLAPNATSAVARAVAFEQKVQQADAIFLGRCIRNQTTLDPSGRWIVTYSTFRVEESYKGAVPPEITIMTPGGELDGLRQETVGVPHFGEGEVNVVFLRSTTSIPTILYFDQGAYRVLGEGRSSRLVAPVPSDLVLIDDQTGRIRSVADEGVRTLEEFARVVRENLTRGPGRLQR